MHSSVSHRSFLSGHACQSVFFDPVTPNELWEISNSFRSGKSAGHDRIAISIITQSIQIIAEPLSHIINLSITRGIVPDQMKIARVVPLLKPVIDHSLRIIDRFRFSLAFLSFLKRFFTAVFTIIYVN